MNLNKIKKICVKFPNWVSAGQMYNEATKQVLKFREARNINAEIATDMFASDSGMQVGSRNLPHIEGFNATFRNDLKFVAHFAMQFTFASGEERKVFRLIEKHNGEIIPIREELHQWGTYDGDDENNPRNQYEKVNETIQCPDKEQYNGSNKFG